MITNNNLINKTLKFSLYDGICYSIMTGFTADYFTPFLLLLGGTANVVGALFALPNICSALIQLKSADFTEKLKSRKNTVALFVLLQALILFPMAIIAFINGTASSIFIAAVVMFVSFGALANPAWSSLMSDIIPMNKRGEYFGWRNKITGFVTVITSLTAGFILHSFTKFNVYYGFAIIFAVAFIFRLISWYFIRQMHEPELVMHNESRFTLIDFLRNARKSNFAKFVFSVSLLNFCVYLVSPFLAVLMIKELKFNYVTYAILAVTVPLTSCFSMKRWGMHADKVGNVKVIKLTSRLIGVIPILWIINQHPIYLFFVQAYGGFVWAGFNLCTANFIFDAVTPEKRTRCVSYFTAFSSLSICFGAMIGALLLPFLPPFMGYSILSLCLISSTMRILVSLLIPTKIQEVRSVEKIGSFELFFSVIGAKPFLTQDD